MWATTRLRWIGAGLGLLACREAPPPPTEHVSPAPAVEPDDDLLARARANIVDGRISPDIVDALLASNDPRHARARRVLQAMDVGEAEAAAEPPSADATAPEPIGPASEPPPAPTASEAVPSAPPPPPVRARASLQGLDLRTAKGGAVLTLRATGNVVVGVANQPGSGIVRLVVEASDAAEAALRARPSIDGVRVTSVQRGGRSLFVTLQLEPGWTLGKVRQFGGGAKVELRRGG